MSRPKFLLRLPRRIVMMLIRAYQKTLSPDHGIVAKIIRRPVCRFHPTCSAYAYEAIKKHGVLRGTPMAAWRVLRCNPWSKGGWDPVP